MGAELPVYLCKLGEIREQVRGNTSTSFWCLLCLHYQESKLVSETERPVVCQELYCNGERGQSYRS